MQCALCHQDEIKEDVQNISGLNVCQSCVRATYLPGRLTGKGLSLGYSYRTDAGVIEVGDEELLDNALRKISALAEAPHPSGIEAKLLKEGLKAKFTKIVEKEIQVGNKAFDDAVWIRTSTNKETAAFLAQNGVQSAVMELIEMNGEISINQHKIYVEATNKGPIEVQMFVLHTAALLHYLTAFSTQSQ